MQNFETGRSDIGIYRETGTGKPVRLVTIGSYGDETVKGLTATEALALAAALTAAATQTETTLAEGKCPACGHWPYRGRHSDIGCFATAGTLKPCGCTHEGAPVPN